MKRIFNILLSVILVVVSAFALTACAPGDSTMIKAKGLSIKKVSENKYTIFKYVDDGTLTNGVLDIGAILQTKNIGGEGVEIKLKKGAFAGNENIVKLIIPATVTEVDEGALKEMQNLEELEVAYVGRTINSDAYYNESAGAENKSVDKARTMAHYFGTEQYKNGVTVTVAGAYTCHMPLSLEKVTVNATSFYDLPNEVRGDFYSIPYQAFEGCNNLTEIVLTGAKLGAIGESAFKGCSELKKITIPSTVKTVYDNAFSACGKLEEVKFEGTGVVLKDGVFEGCVKMSKFNDTADKTINVDSFSAVGENALDFGRENVLFSLVNTNALVLTSALGQTKIN